MVHNPSIGENKKNWQQYNIISCIHHYRKGKETGVKMSPAVVSGIVIGDATVRYLLIFFPVHRNSLKSLCKSYFFKMANCHTGMLPPCGHFLLTLVTLAPPKFEKRKNNQYFGISRRDVFVWTAILIIRVSTVSADHVHISRDDQTEDLFACPQRLGF